MHSLFLLVATYPANRSAHFVAFHFLLVSSLLVTKVESSSIYSWNMMTESFQSSGKSPVLSRYSISNKNRSSVTIQVNFTYGSISNRIRIGFIFLDSYDNSSNSPVIWKIALQIDWSNSNILNKSFSNLFQDFVTIIGLYKYTWCVGMLSGCWWSRSESLCVL